MVYEAGSVYKLKEGDNLNEIRIYFSVCFLGNCIDYTGSYGCTCNPGYAGENCAIDIDECASSPCRHGLLSNNILIVIHNASYISTSISIIYQYKGHESY